MAADTTEDGSDYGKISVSTGTEGGVQPASGSDDPPDKTTFKENIDFDINYQQSGRVTGQARGHKPASVGRRKRRVGYSRRRRRNRRHRRKHMRRRLR